MLNAPRYRLATINNVYDGIEIRGLLIGMPRA